MSPLGWRRSEPPLVHVKLAQVPGEVVAAGEVVGAKQHKRGVHPTAGQTKRSGCGRGVPGAGHVKLAQVAGVVVAAGDVVGCKQHLSGTHPDGGQTSPAG